MVPPLGVDSAPRVEGVNLVMYLGKQFDLNRVATRVGSYQAGMGCSTHDVFDMRTDLLHPLVRDHIPDTIASDCEGTVIRLYVPVGNRGQISDIGIVNASYKAPAHPWYSRSGHVPMYVAPADLAKYKNHPSAHPSRPPKTEWQHWGDPNWRPGPGDRFKVTEHW